MSLQGRLRELTARGSRHSSFTALIADVGQLPRDGGHPPSRPTTDSFLSPLSFSRRT
jgi:hypothetical protein